MNLKTKFNIKNEIKSKINLLKKIILKNKNIKSLILGISGGIDSTLAGKICYMTVKKLKNQNKKIKFLAINLPYKKKIDNYCKEVLKFIKPTKFFCINITPIIEINKKIFLKNKIELNDLFIGNLKSRERMKILYYFANLFNGIVIGTSNAVEIITGYFTKYGDGASDIKILKSFNKRQIINILKYLKCPKIIYSQIPTANLLDKYPNLPDEQELGIKYNIIDDYLEGKKIKKKEKTHIEKMFLKTKHKRNKF